jgi:hypothetical protein
MNVKEYVKELAYPARSLGMMMALITFFLLLTLASTARLLGIWLAVAVVPAFFRYLVMIAQARARGVDAEPPGAEFFTLVGNFWTLFPVLPAAAFGFGTYYLATTSTPAAVAAFGMATAAIVPAMMAVLVITQSPTQSLNPVALFTLIRETGNAYWYAPFTLLLVFFVPALFGSLPNWLQNILWLYLVFAFYAVTGAITREKNLIDDVYIDDPLEPDVEKQIAGLDKARVDALSHAYGFVSRGNREGGLRHIFAWLEKDPDPDAAWPWFFEGMLKWENNDGALYFAQRYISRLLVANDSMRVNKVILRCQMVNERFRPLADDIPAAIDAAERCGNQALAESLKRL